MRLRLLVPLCIAAWVASCNPAATPCSRVTCDTGFTCNALTGICQKSSAGGGGGGGVGGGGGGTTDGGNDCDPACSNGTVCDTSTRTCVGCLSDSDCGCPTPVCSSNTCIAGTPDGGATQQIGESCLSPAPVLFPGCGSTASFHVDLSTLSDDETGTCSAPMSLGKDAVFSLTLDQSHDVTVTTTPASGVQPLVYLRAGACESGSELLCRDTFGVTSTVKLKALPAGTYWLILDSYDPASAGGVDVNVQLDPPTPPGNETCGTAQSLDTDGGVVTVDLSTADDDDQGSCNANAFDAPEVVYKISLAEPLDLHLSATPQDLANDSALLYVRQSPCRTGAELYCVNPPQGAETVRLRALPAGDYYVFIEAPDRSLAGPTDVSAWVTPASPPPPNDTCAAPRLIDFPSGTTQLSFPVDTSEAADDYPGSCNGQPLSPEVVFQLHVTATANYLIDVTAASGSSALPVVYLRTNPCDFPSVVAPPDSGVTVDAGLELGCSTSEVTRTLNPGDYFIYVEGQGLTGAGPTTLTVSVQ